MDSPLIAVGKVVGPWGNQGKIKVEALTPLPERFSPGSQVLIQGHYLTIEECFRQKDRFILKLASVDTVSQAEELRGQLLEVPAASSPPLPADSYYFYQLQGLEVWDKARGPLGRLEEILAGPDNETYVVRGGEKEYLIPAAADFVLEVNLRQGRLLVELPQSMLE